jgi:hypothetical protein
MGSIKTSVPLKTAGISIGSRGSQDIEAGHQKQAEGKERFFVKFAAFPALGRSILSRSTSHGSGVHHAFTQDSAEQSHTAVSALRGIQVLREKMCVISPYQNIYLSGTASTFSTS